MSAPASGELFDVVVTKAVELEARVKELESKLEAQTEQRKITTGERDRAELRLDELRRDHGSRWSRVANAVESLRSTFTLRADCNNIEDAVADACAELERVQVKRDKYRVSYESKCTEADEATSLGWDNLETAIAEAIGPEADSVDVEIVQIVANIKRQRDEARADLESTRSELELAEKLNTQLCDARETNAALDAEMRAYDELTFIGVCEERDKLKADLEVMTADRDRYKAFEHDVSAFDASVVISKHAAEQNAEALAIKVKELKDQLADRAVLAAAVIMSKTEARDILTRCDQGVQNCHRCPALGCGDNAAGRM